MTPRSRHMFPALLGFVALFGSHALAQRPVVFPPRPAGDSDYIRFEADIFTALNQARTDPVAFAKTLEELLPAFHDNVVEYPGSYSIIRMTEGDSALREAIRVVRAMKPVPALKLDKGLSQAARDHVLDQGRTGQTEHIGSDSSLPQDRAERYGRVIGAVEENLAYAPIGLSGLQNIEALIIDDGVANRGHRRNIFDQDVHVVGIACGPHIHFGTECVIDFVGDYKPWSGP